MDAAHFSLLPVDDIPPRGSSETIETLGLVSYFDEAQGMLHDVYEDCLLIGNLVQLLSVGSQYSICVRKAHLSFVPS